jgi:hypothetical protein
VIELKTLDREKLKNHYQVNPSLVFRRGSPNLFELSTVILEGALCLGCSRIEIEIFQEWHVIKGNYDWLSENPSRSEDYFFFSMTAFPELDVNSLHWEFYLPIYCKDTFIARNNEIRSIHGGTEIPEKLKQILLNVPSNWRTLAFQL